MQSGCIGQHKAVDGSRGVAFSDAIWLPTVGYRKCFSDISCVGSFVRRLGVWASGPRSIFVVD